MRFSRLPLLLFSVIALVVAGLLTPVSASAAPYCGIYWGSLAKQGMLSGDGPDYLSNVRAGQHDCYDRLVLDLETSGLSQPSANWWVQYVSQVPAGESDKPLPMRGGAFITIRFTGSAHTPDWVFTYNPVNPLELVNVTGYRTFRQVALAEDFEGQIVIGLGVRARLPFRVSTLPSGTSWPYGARLVIDVAHQW